LKGVIKSWKWFKVLVIWQNKVWYHLDKFDNVYEGLDIY
jgi:hypothetical protein